MSRPAFRAALFSSPWPCATRPDDQCRARSGAFQRTRQAGRLAAGVAAAPGEQQRAESSPGCRSASQRGHVDLPKASSSAGIARPEHPDLALHADGGIWWQGQPVDHDELGRCQQAPRPELRRRANAGRRYESLALATHIGLVSQPETP